MASHVEWLFSGTLDDLKERVDSNNTYQVLMTSGLLRKLLLDDKISLLNQVNRARKIPIAFSFVPQVPPDPSEAYLWGAMDGLDGLGDPKHPALKEHGLSAFLQHPVLQSGIERFTVAEVIRHGAHIMGGVHAGVPKGRDLVLEAMAHLGVDGAPALVRSLQSIGRITHRALLPLRQDIVRTDRQERVRARRQALSRKR